MLWPGGISPRTTAGFPTGMNEKHRIQIISVDSPIGMNESRSSNDSMLWMLNNRATTPVFCDSHRKFLGARPTALPITPSFPVTQADRKKNSIRSNYQWKGSWSNKNAIAYSVMTGGNFPPYHSWFSNWDEWKASNPNHPCWFADLRMIVCYKCSARWLQHLFYCDRQRRDCRVDASHFFGYWLSRLEQSDSRLEQ